MGRERWSGRYHIVNTATGESLQSEYTETTAQKWCEDVNNHEKRNGRPAVYKVQEHDKEWRKG